MRQQPTDQSGVTPGGPVNHWMQEAVVEAFVEQTTAHEEQRHALFDFAVDLFPFKPDARIRVLDLGAGYGAFAAAVLDRFPNATAVGLDISAPMMAVGRERMARFADRFSYHVGDLSEGALPADLPGPFDAAVTSAFVLHLPRAAKQRLYAGVFRLLNPGGCLVDVDLVAPANAEMQAWYQEWGEREGRRRGDQPGRPPTSRAPTGHDQFGADAHHLAHHHVETEADQLAFLRATGFVRVDCFYKRLRQAVIAGYKPGNQA